MALFLATTVLASVTGFMFPAVTITPAAIFGAISLAVLAWRWIYVVTALLALYLNVVVLVPSRRSPSCIRWRRPARSRPS